MYIHTVMLLKTWKICIIEVINHKIDSILKIKSLVAWSISEGRVDQKQIINFVRPYAAFCHNSACAVANYRMHATI